MAMQPGPAALGPHSASLVAPSSGTGLQFLHTLTGSQRWHRRKPSFIQLPETTSESLAAPEPLQTMEVMQIHLLPTRSNTTHSSKRNHFFICLCFPFPLLVAVAFCSLQGNTSPVILSLAQQASTGCFHRGHKAHGSWRQPCPRGLGP